VSTGTGTSSPTFHEKFFQGRYFRDVLLAAGFDEEKHPEVRHVQFEGTTLAIFDQEKFCFFLPLIFLLNPESGSANKQKKCRIQIRINSVRTQNPGFFHTELRVNLITI
jgi:hypothetical protein